jgi:hypothetical protein
MKQRKIYKKKLKKSLHTHKKQYIKPYKKFQINANTKIQTHTKNSKSLCAPFIEPTSLSKGNYLSKSNVNIIKSATDESCFSIDALRKIATKWNTETTSNPNMKIQFDNNTSGHTLWSSINNVMKYKCNNEICWMKQDFIKDSPLAKELLKNFKPLMPKKWLSNPIEWLNTIDIRDVMNQYEIKYPHFEFIGPVPMDFDTKVGFGQCVIDELCKINLNDLMKKGKSKIGVVFNLDKHTQSGSHWVAMYGDFKGENGLGKICYWDSYGMKPNKEVVVLMERLKKQAIEIGHNVDIKINTVRHQYKNSECGVYCIYFLTSLLDGEKSFENIVENIVKDDDMNAKRIEYFNNSD